MYRAERRDKSGPMDIDNPDPTARLVAYALADSEQGPSRKRPHTDFSTPSRPFAHPSTSKPLNFGQNTPFIFHLPDAPLPPAPDSAPFRPYNPAEWANADFGFEKPVQGALGGWKGLEDVDMSNGSPARPVDGRTVGGGMKDEATAEGSQEGETKGAEGRPIAMGAVGRVKKRRQKEWRRRRRDSESDGEVVDRPDTRKSDLAPGQAVKSEHTYHFNVPAPALRHSEIPAILLGYLQFFFNAAVVLFVLYLALQFVLTVRRDVKDRMQEVSIEILQEISECTQLYLTNRCDPALRVPAMDGPCRAWEACMNRDPTIVGRTNVMAETFAGVINSFVDPISWKTMGFTLVTLSFLIVLTNSALFNLRSRAHHEPPPQAQPHQEWYPPQPYMHNYRQLGQHANQGVSGGPPAPGQIGWKEPKKGWW